MKKFLGYLELAVVVSGTVVGIWAGVASNRYNQTAIQAGFLAQISGHPRAVSLNRGLQERANILVRYFPLAQTAYPGEAPEKAFAKMLVELEVTATYSPGSYYLVLERKHPEYIVQALSGSSEPAQILWQDYKRSGIDLYPIGLTGILIFLFILHLSRIEKRDQEQK